MINGLVGIGKGISTGQGLDNGEDLSDQRAEPSGSLGGGLEITFFQIFDNGSELPGKAIGRTEEKTVIRPPGLLQPAGIISLGAAYQKDVTLVDGR